jgi:RNA polymerase-binding transcription factor DksA
MNNEFFKKRLEEELHTVEGELKTVGAQNPKNPSDWEPKETEIDVTNNEDDELGDKMEELAENTAINDALEIRYNQIKRALDKIKEGTYGVCEIGGEPIEEKRLEADPAAVTCIAHKDQEA